jgi:hypothetical protein
MSVPQDKTPRRTTPRQTKFVPTRFHARLTAPALADILGRAKICPVFLIRVGWRNKLRLLFLSIVSTASRRFLFVALLFFFTNAFACFVPLKNSSLENTDEDR